MQINSELGEMNLKGLYCFLFCSFQVNKIWETYKIYIAKELNPATRLAAASRWSHWCFNMIMNFSLNKKTGGTNEKAKMVTQLLICNI